MPTTDLYTSKVSALCENNPSFQQFAVSIAKQARTSLRDRYLPQDFLRHIEESYKIVKHDAYLQMQATEKGAVVHSIMKDQPFIVDTLRMHLNAFGAISTLGYNAVLSVTEDSFGIPTNKDDNIKSVIRFDVLFTNKPNIEEMQQVIKQKLDLAKYIVADFKYMTSLLEQSIKQFERSRVKNVELEPIYKECSDFVSWLLQDNFVFMGMEHQTQTSNELLGVVKDEVIETLGSGLDTYRNWKPEYGELEIPISVRKSHLESPVHRLGQIDEIHIALPDNQGFIKILGLFTHRAVTQLSRRVPLLRRTLASILREDNSQASSYRYKGICNVFDSLPTEFLFTAKPELLGQIIDRILDAEQDQEPRTKVVRTERSDNSFVVVAIPQGLWNDDLRHNIKDILMEETQATYCDSGVFVGRYNTVLAHYFLTGNQKLDREDNKRIEALVTERCTRWENRVLRKLAQIVGEGEADRIFRIFGSDIQSSYKKFRPLPEVAEDFCTLDRLLHGETGPIVKMFFPENRNRAYLRIYQGKNLVLSDMMPVIDNFGIRIVDQFADPIPVGDRSFIIDTFRLEEIEGLDLETFRERSTLLCEGIEAVLQRKVSNDSLNTLVLKGGLSWQAVDMFRGIYGYAHQIQLSYNMPQVQSILTSSIQTTHSLWKFFQAKFDPSLENREVLLQQYIDEAETNIRQLTNQSQDLVFRMFFNLIESMLRTNYYRTDRKEHYTSFKFDCATIQNLPGQRLMVEVYVHHRDMEGIHLRGGKIARGGIRWSDRTDFRREVLDLVTTQMVKNVLIVPEGSKGGFRIKEVISDRRKLRQKADELYQILIRGLLDITDNRVGDDIVTPPNVIRHDDLDPYLVVAADKGTAHLSDTANRLSSEYGFWLDDAFASGGSNGYDHKEVGITARGAWVTTKRHFREIGKDPEQTPFTVVGIGDPAGDVFGNGVTSIDYLTKPNNKMKLLGAFNHIHIFLDPDPDPDASYAERKRLFDAVEGWGGYDTNKLSQGGGIYLRSSKSIPLSPEVQKMLGVLKEELPPEVVIRLLLRLNVDLLWNGGIGTYVKSSLESDQDAGDPSNDILRINANELRAQMIGEGGNLGFTQKGRIEYALQGGHLNNDAIDNSGGVDMSDHEVNLKILLNPLVQKEKMTFEERNKLLASMTEEVAKSVLHNNDTHGKQLSLDKVRSEIDPLHFSSTIQWICLRGNISRQTLNLPTDEELLDRQELGQGLTRPELAVLGAHVKMHIFKDLSDISLDELNTKSFSNNVHAYFPQKIQTQYPDQINQHMLYKSIGNTMLLNDIVGDAGSWLFPGLMEITGASASAVVQAWQLAMNFIDAKEYKQKINNAETSIQAKYHAWVAITSRIYPLLIRWLSQNKLPSQEKLQLLRQILERIPFLSGTTLKETFVRRKTRYQGLNIPSEFIHGISLLGELQTAYEITCSLYRSDQTISQSEIDTYIVSYYAIGDASLLLQTIKLLDERRSTGGWDLAANAILRNQFLDQLQELLRGIELGREANLGIDRVSLRLSRNHLNDFQTEINEILGDTPDLASLMVANARIQSRILRSFSGTPLKGTGLN